MCGAVFTRSTRNRPWRCWPSMLPILGGAAEESPAGAGLVRSDFADFVGPIDDGLSDLGHLITLAGIRPLFHGAEHHQSQGFRPIVARHPPQRAEHGIDFSLMLSAHRLASSQQKIAAPLWGTAMGYPNNPNRAAASAKAAVGSFFPAGGVVSVVSVTRRGCAGASTVFPRSATASLLWSAASRLGNAGGAVSAEHHRAGRHPRRADAGLLGEPSHLADFAPAGAPEMLRHHSVSHGRRSPLLIAPG